MSCSGNCRKSNPFVGPVEDGNARSLSRKHLAKAFGNLYNSGLGKSPLEYERNILGPFRTSFNAGDIITNRIVETDSRYGKESNQVNGNNLSRSLNLNYNGKSGQNGKAMYSGNTRFVHDGSDYIKFKKLQAINRDYKDPKANFGGANNSQEQHAFTRSKS
jgi:hypothetical protein